jgi:hypothetical protein
MRLAASALGRELFAIAALIAQEGSFFYFPSIS